MRKAIWSYVLACSGLLLIPLVGLIYIQLNQANGKVYSLVTNLDRQIPFMKAFVVPYLSWYGFLMAAFLYLAYKDRAMYYQTLFRYIIGLLVCYGVYAIYQTTVPRPEITGSDWLLGMVQWVYHNDQPYNCFPSIHVLTSYLMMKAYLNSSSLSRFSKIVVSSAALLIIASTLFVKQHVVLDIVGAVLVAEGVWYVAERLRKGLLTETISLSSQQRKVEGGQ